jgi:uncharacterized membrane protein YhaH (DUF805 family)
MTLAYDYPMWDVFWSLLGVFLFVAWIMVVFAMLVDVFRSHEMSAVAKGLWVVVVLLIPFIGVLIYLIVHGDRLSTDARGTLSREDVAYLNYTQRGR